MPGGGLTSVEQSLVEHVSRGERLDLGHDDGPVSEAAMRSWGDSQTCRAAVIRDILRGRLAPDPDPRGLRLRRARITGQLDLESVATDVNLELTDCLLEEGILARDARLASVILSGCLIEHPDDPLDGTRLACSKLILDRASVTGGGYDGAVRLYGARIGGQFDCRQARLGNGSGPALDADSLAVGQDMFLGGAIITGSGGDGAVRLSSARIGGQLDCTYTRLDNNSGPALDADSLMVDQDMFLRAAIITGSGGDGAVRLSGAQIGGQLDCREASLRNDSGPALDADRLKVAEGMSLGRVTATGTGNAGAVRLSGAQIGDQLDCREARLRNDSGPALAAASLAVGQAMLLTSGFTAIGGGDAVVIDLTGASVDGAFVLDPARLEHQAAFDQRLTVDGLTYASMPELISLQDWLRLLRQGTPHYAAQPYQQLAAVYQAMGAERQVRQILMSQRDDQLTRTPTRWPEKSWGWINKVAVGYGYQPWRLALFVTAVVAVSCVLAVGFGSRGALAQTDKTATPGRPCSITQELSVGMDLGLPFGTSLAREDCGLPKKPSTAATWLTGIELALRVLAWAFAAWFAVLIVGTLRSNT